jgi:hypothetical protein
MRSHATVSKQHNANLHANTSLMTKYKKQQCDY